jgi:hypothetical protein
MSFLSTVIVRFENKGTVDYSAKRLRLRLCFKIQDYGNVV